MFYFTLSGGLKIQVDKDIYEQYKNKKMYSVGGYASWSENKKTIFLHRVIANTPKGMCTDHINGNRQDNRRENLRVCTHAENNRNSKKQINGSSKYKGVTRMKYGWRAQIWYENKIYLLGLHKTQEQAAEAYNKKALELHKDFARLNLTP